MDEVFGEANFLAQVVVNLNPKGRQLGKGFATSHEYLLVYARDAKRTVLDASSPDTVVESDFPLVDETGRRYRHLPLRNTNKKFNPVTARTLHFPVYGDPDSGAGADPAVRGRPRDRAGVRRRQAGGVAVERAADRRARRRPGLPADQGQARRAGRRVPEGLAAPRHPRRPAQEAAHDLAGRGGRARPTPRSPSSRRSSGTSSSHRSRPGWCGGSSRPCRTTSLVLDFFAGSGTTGHAVALANDEDGGTRRCVSVNSAEPTRAGSNARTAGLVTVADITRARLRAVAERLGGGLDERP